MSRRRSRSRRWTRCAWSSRPRAFRSRRVRGATDFWWSTIPTAISSSSTIRARLHPAGLLEIKHNRAAVPIRPLGSASSFGTLHSHLAGDSAVTVWVYARRNDAVVLYPSAGTHDSDPGAHGRRGNEGRRVVSSHGEAQNLQDRI